MASCKLGHVYIVNTALSQPPKEKYAVCICVDPRLFVWINSKARPHGKDQLQIEAGCHELVKHDSHIDLSKLFAHPDFEMEVAKEFARISKELCQRIIEQLESNEMLSRQHIDLIKTNLGTLLA